MHRIDIPEIVTDRLLLRAVEPGDAEDIHNYVSSPNVLRYTSWATPSDLFETREFVRRLIWKPEGAFALAIRFLDNPRVIGILEFGSRGELGGVDYSLAEEFWNHGIMTEAVQATIDWAFKTLPALQTISSSAMPVNRGSTRVMEKCGMTFKRLLQDKFERSDEPVTLAEYVIGRQDWCHRRP